MSSNLLSDAYPGCDLRWTSSTPVTSDRLRILGMVLVAVILVVTGSYIRTRAVDESDTADWLVLLQFGLSAIAGLVGMLLLRKHSFMGTGARLQTLYLLAAITSAVFSRYSMLVAAYWTLLAGTSMLCIGLISSSPNANSVQRIERLMLVTLSFMIVKDTIINFFFLELPDTDDLYRLGEGTTSANSLGLAAALAFCMSLGLSSGHRIRWFILRAFFVAAMILTRSRVALIALLAGCILRLWFAKRLPRRSRSHLLLAAIPLFLMSLAVLGVMAWTMRVPAVTAAVDFVNRGEDSSEVMSVTGRTDIWPYAIERILEGKTSLLFGHGYGASKEVLNENNWRARFFAYHSHNTILELLVSTGVAGTLPFLLLIAYSLRWFLGFFESCATFSSAFTLRAIAAITAILSSMMTESDLATKVGPILIVFMFYAMTLDRRRIYAE